MAAKPALADLCRTHPDDLSLQGIYAMDLAKSGDFERAEEVIATGLTQGNSATLHAARALLIDLADEEQNSEEAGQLAIALDPKDPLALVWRNDAAQRHGDYEEARSIIDHLSAIFPNSTAAYTMRITLALAQQDLDEAQRLLDDAPDWFRATWAFHGESAAVALFRHQTSEIDANVKRAIEKTPGPSSLHGFHAVVQCMLHRYNDAEKSARTAIDLNKRDHYAWRALSIIAKHRGNADEAEDHRKRANDAVPGIAGTAGSWEIADCLRRKDYDGALRIYKEQSESRIASVAALGRRAGLDLLVRLGRWDQARHLLQICTEKGDRSLMIEALRLRIGVQDGAKQEALPQLRALLNETALPAAGYPIILAALLAAGSEEDVDTLVARLASGIGNASKTRECVLNLLRWRRRAQAYFLVKSALNVYPNSPAIYRAAVDTACAHRDFLTAIRFDGRLKRSVRVTLTLGQVLEAALLRRIP